MAKKLTDRDFASALGTSLGTAWNYRKLGMPTESIEAAKEWVAGRVTHRRKLRDFKTNDVRADQVEVGGETLESVIVRLRKIEKATAEGLQRAIDGDRVMESVALRKEHLTALKALYTAEAQLLKINEVSGRLVPIDRCLGMINESVQAGLLVLRRLPELARDAEEKQRLESFMNAVLEEFKAGARQGFENAA